MRHHQDPVPALGQTLACALIAQTLSVLLAALLAAEVPGGYRVRSGVFLGGLLWSVAGTVLLLVQTARGARGSGRGEHGIRLSRIALWLVSAWIWPVLVRWRRPDAGSDPG